MNTIYKYDLKVADIQFLELPPFTRLLCVQSQLDTPRLWAEVPTELESRVRLRVTTIATGNPVLEDAGDYLGTYQLYGGKLVFHVYTKWENI